MIYLIYCIFIHLLDNLTGVWQTGKIVNDMQKSLAAFKHVVVLDQHFNLNAWVLKSYEFKNIKLLFSVKGQKYDQFHMKLQDTVNPKNGY